MKKSEFKSLVKECVRECLREIMQEQINPTGLQEMLHAPNQMAMVPQGGMAGLGLVNPMDDQGMRIRQEIMAQRGMMQTQLQRQAMQNPLNPMNHQMPALDQLAGLGGIPDRPPEQRFNTSNSGYTNPSERLRMAGPSRADRDPRYDPSLDYRPNQPAPQQRQQEQRVLRLDPDLDTPVGGGPIRPPDPNLLRSIYDDTMRTTFMEQAAGERNGPAVMTDKYAAAVAQKNPDELFMGSQNWAMLAFQK